VGRWDEHAACQGTPLDWWFFRENVPEELTGSWEREAWLRTATTRARRICDTCPVQPDCLAAVMWEEAPKGPGIRNQWTSSRHGFRGGMTPRERARYAETLKASA
jgi:hypothetical protein